MPGVTLLKTTRILLNGRTFDVTDNLAAALRRLRSRKAIFTFWADAICIDQGDNAEKSQQVRLMDKFYEDAAQAIIWLGEEDPESDRAMTILKRLGIDKDPDSVVVLQDEYSPTAPPKKKSWNRRLLLNLKGLPG